MTTTDTQLHLAKRMSRLGTETAFEVLVRARALERQGRNIIHLEIGEPDMDTPANVVEAGVNALREGFTHYGPSAGLPDLREAIAKDVAKSRGIPVQRRRSRGGSRRQAHHLLHHAGAGGRGRRGHLSQSRLPDLRVDDQFRRRQSCADPASRGARLPPRRQRTERPDHRPHQAHHPQLAAESDRRNVITKQDMSGHCRRHWRSRHHGPERRDLQPPALRRRALQHRVGARHSRSAPSSSTASRRLTR